MPSIWEPWAVVREDLLSEGHPPTIRSAAADRFHAGGMPLTSLWWRPMGATLARSAAIGQRAIAISAGPPLRRGALRGAHGNPGRARALAWNRVCGAIGFEFSDGRGFGALLKVLRASERFIELTTR